MNRLRRLLLLPLLLAAALVASSWTVGAQAAGAAPPPCHETQAPTGPDGHRDGVLARLACALHCAGCLVEAAAQPERAGPSILRPLAVGAPTPEGRAADRLDRPPKPA
ncbi:MAG: hypothetical protein IPL88_12205 [Rhizobiales bacterium]|nr:hypothetical protein [Hyphomicrobiales bacterium]